MVSGTPDILGSWLVSSSSEDSEEFSPFVPAIGTAATSSFFLALLFTAIVVNRAKITGALTAMVSWLNVIDHVRTLFHVIGSSGSRTKPQAGDNNVSASCAACSMTIWRAQSSKAFRVVFLTALGNDEKSRWDGGSAYRGRLRWGIDDASTRF